MVRIAVVGAGASGITAVKTCLEYGYNVVCFEKTRDLGGLWRYKPRGTNGHPSVMKSTTLISSKELSAFSDYPPPAEYANYMHNRKVVSYFRSYAEHFGVLPHVKCNQAVETVRRAEDYDSTGRWTIRTKDLENGQTTTETFDGVMLCSGHYIHPFVPKFPGLQDGIFKGQVIHSRDYKDGKEFEDKNVVVVGIGNTGADVTVELSRIARQVYLSTRHGSWIWHRVYDDGLPLDLWLNSHYVSGLKKIAPNLLQAVLERKLMKRFDLRLYGLMPAHHFFQQTHTVSDELPIRILSGAVQVKTNIERAIGPKRLRFADGTEVDDVDAVVLCTGYKIGNFPYLEPGIIDTEDYQVELYKHMYPPTLSRPESLAAIGLVQPTGSLFPLAEIQSRVFCEYLKGPRRLPGREDMYKDIRAKADYMKNHYIRNKRYSVHVLYVPYIHEMAAMVDAEPSPWTYLLKGDFKLAKALAFGPCLPYKFRLRGPHAWSGARDAILTVWDRVAAPMQTRVLPEHESGEKIRLGFQCYMREYKGKIFTLGTLFVTLVVAAVEGSS